MIPEIFHLERVATPTGRMLILTDDEGRLRAVDWEDHEQRMLSGLRRLYRRHAFEIREMRRVSDARRALLAYFDGDLDAIAGLRTASQGTEFQRKVWAALRRIPVGKTTSYGALAARLGMPKASRAVGLANGANPICIVVPCHRVIGANGDLTGFGGGIERKRWLLAHEQGATARSAKRAAASERRDREAASVLTK